MALTDLSKKTKAELSTRISDLERLIARKGLGSKYVARVERVQRRLNIVLLLGTATAVAGFFTWLALRSDQEED